MGTLSPLARDSTKIWFNKSSYDLAERKFYERLAKPHTNLSSSPKECKERKSEINSQVNNQKCFVDLEKDGAGLVKIPGKVWVDKPRYDMAEKEFYEKREKSRLISLGKYHIVQEKIVASRDESRNFTFGMNTVKDVQQESVNITEKSNIKSVHINTSVLNNDGINGKRGKNLEIGGVKISPPIGLIETESKKRTRLDEPSEIKENPKPQKIRLTEEKYLNDTVKDKRNIPDGKKSQENILKLPKGAQNPVVKKSTNLNPSLPKNKSTNVNTIPSFPKMSATINGSMNVVNKGNNNNNVMNEKKNITNNIQQTFELDVNVCKDNHPPIIKTKDSSPIPVNDDLQNKKETKKNKKNKKRHRDEKGVSQNANSWNSLAGEVAKARQHIKNSLQCIDDIASITSSNVVIEVNNRINSLEKENLEMKQKVKELTDLLSKFEQRITLIEKNTRPSDVGGSSSSKSTATHVSTQSAKQPCDEEDDGVDLFGSDSEEESAEAVKLKEQRLAEYAAKKSKKPAVIAKSNIVLDVKPWDDTTDMKLMEKEVRKITEDGLLWGASKLVPLAYGIHKLQISCVVEDDKVSVDMLQETIEAIEDYVQSVDIAAFNKI